MRSMGIGRSNKRKSLTDFYYILLLIIILIPSANLVHAAVCGDTVDLYTLSLASLTILACASL